MPFVVDIEKQEQEKREETITQLASNHDISPVASRHHVENEDIYQRFSERRKIVITGVLAYCGFLAPISSTTVLSAIPEVASTYGTSGSIINLTNACYLIAMGISPIVLGPFGQVYGRRIVCLICSLLFFVFSLGTALAPDLASFFVFRILTACQGTCFLIIGSSCIGDIYKPTERATALGWFLSGTLIGPALGPLIGGIIVTFRSWRDVFWFQTALGGFAFLLILTLLPETIHHKRATELTGLSTKQYARKLWGWTNPIRVVRLFRYPNLLTVGLASSALVWNMYCLLTPIRYVLNPRFGLDSPLQSALFYIAPGCGYILGTFFGGRWADHVVKKWIRKRGGERIPEDRLRSSLTAMGAVIPGSILIYGWSVEKAKGGIAVPVIAMFVQGVAQLFCFPSLNTYCLDVMQGRSAEIIAGNYILRYSFGALGSAVVLPAIQKIGVGWFSTISALFLVVVTILVYITTLFGRSWREAVDQKKESKQQQATNGDTSRDPGCKEDANVQIAAQTR